MASNRKIGATIQLDGEKQFRAAVTQATASLKTMKSEMKLVSAEFAGQENTLEALTKKHEVLEKTLEQTKKVESETAAALENANKNYESAGKSLDEYKTALEASQKELEKMQKSGNATDEALAEQEAKISDLARAVKSGETAYARAGQNVEAWSQKLNAAKTDVLTLSRELEENGRYMQEAASSADGTARSIDGFGKKIRENTKEASDGVRAFSDDVDKYFTANKIQEYATAVSDAFLKVATSAYESAKDLDEGYDNIIKRTGATGHVLEEMMSSADSLYGRLPVDMNKVGEAIGEVTTRWHLEGNELERVSEIALKFSELNRTDVVQSIDSAQNMMSAFGESIEHISTAFDVMNATGQKTGVDLSTIASKVTENAAAFQELGLDVYQAIDFMGQLETSGADAATVLSGMKRALKSATEDGKNFGQALAEMEDLIRYGTDGMDGLQAAYELFGKSGAGIYTAVKSGTLSFKDLAESQKLVAESADSVAKTYEATLDPWDEITTAVHSFKSAGADLAGDVLSDIAPAISTLADGVRTLRDGLNSMSPAVKKVISWTAAIGAGVGIVVPQVIALRKGFQALKAAGGVAKTLSDFSKGLKGLSAAGKTADAVSDVAEAVGDVAKVSKGASDVAKMADAVEDVTDVASSAANLDKMADGIEGVASAATSAQAAVTSLSIATQAFLGAGIAVAAVGAIGAVFSKLDEVFVETHKDLRDTEEYVDHLVDTSNERISETNALLSDMRGGMDSIEFKQTKAQPLIEELSELQNSSEMTNSKLYRMERICTELNAIYPDLGLSVNRVTGEVERNGRAISNLSKVTESYYETAREEAARGHYTDIVSQSLLNEQEMKRIEEQWKELAARRKELTDSFKEASDDGSNIFGALGWMGGWNEEWVELNHVQSAMNDLADQYEALSGRQTELNKEQEDYLEILTGTENGLNGAAGAMGANADSVAIVSDKYEELAKKMRDAGGALSDLDFSESEADIQAIYESTVKAWQDYHDAFTDGMKNEISSLSDAMNAWADYRDQVKNSLKSNSDLFKETSTTQETSWEEMTSNMNENIRSYERWNETVGRILSSARYANDDTFREMANSIMLMGVSGSEYLQELVNNVDLSTDIALGDLGRFADMAGIKDRYASNMASLQLATEEGMNGIASAYDSTATEAQISMQSLSDALQQQAQAYESWYENVEELTNSDRYQSDEAFREFVNNILSYGMAGAEQLDAVVQSMEQGSEELDQAIQSYTELKGADEKAAQAQSSIQTTLQDGFTDQVRIVDDAQSALAAAYGNYADAGVQGFSNRIDYLDGVIDGGLTRAEQAIQDSQEGMNAAADGVMASVDETVQTGMDNTINGIRTKLIDFATEMFGLGSNLGVSLMNGVVSGVEGSGTVSAQNTRRDQAGKGDTTINMTVNGAGADPETVARIASDRITAEMRREQVTYAY